MDDEADGLDLTAIARLRHLRELREQAAARDLGRARRRVASARAAEREAADALVAQMTRRTERERELVGGLVGRTVPAREVEACRTELALMDEAALALGEALEAARGKVGAAREAESAAGETLRRRARDRERWDAIGARAQAAAELRRELSEELEEHPHPSRPTHRSAGPEP